MAIQKVISGGQTGVDQAALRMAISIHLPVGGWCPPGRVCDEGLIPAVFPLQETPVATSMEAPAIPRSLRTQWNVRDADATVILMPGGIVIDKGTRWTVTCARQYRKKYIIVDPYLDQSTDKVIRFLRDEGIFIVNVAGPAERTCPGIGGHCFQFLRQVFSILLSEEKDL